MTRVKHPTRSLGATRCGRWCRRLAVAVLLLFPLAVMAQEREVLNDTFPTYRMIATFYADRFHGRKTSSGEIFDQNKMTAAHKGIRLGTWLRVTNLHNDKQVFVKVNDRCPKNGVLDLSKAAAHSIGIIGVGRVRVEILPSEDVAQQLKGTLSYDDSLDVATQGSDWADDGFFADEGLSRRASEEKNSNHSASKTAATAKPSTPSADREKQATPTGQTAEKNDGKPVDKKKEKSPTVGKGRYNLFLGTFPFDQVVAQRELLPTPYRDYLETRVSRRGVDLILNVQQTRKQAKKTLRSLQRSFPDGRLVDAY